MSGSVATPCGSVQVATDAGTLVGPTATPVPSTPPSPTGLIFSCALIGFEVDGVGPGGSATVTVTTPITPTAYWKLEHSAWTQVPGATVVGGVVTFTLTDGSALDGDGLPNGVIVDPGGPVIAQATTPAAAAVGVTPRFTG